MHKNHFGKILLITILMIIFTINFNYSASKPIKFWVNDVNLPSMSYQIIDKKEVLIQSDVLFNKMGYKTVFDKKSSKISVVIDGKTVIFQKDKNFYLMNAVKVNMPTKSIIYNNSLLIPLSQIDKIVGNCKTTYDIEYGNIIGVCISNDINVLMDDYLYLEDYKNVEKYLKLGANPNYVDNLGWVPLKKMSYKSNEVYIVLSQLLIDYGADVNYVNDDGNSLLYETIADSNYEMFKVLFDNGADINFKTRDGRSLTYFANCLLDVYEDKDAIQNLLKIIQYLP